MAAESLSLHRWVFPLEGTAPPPDQYRTMERIVTSVAGPAALDPIVSEHAAAVFIAKRAGETDPPSGVWLNVVASDRAESTVVTAVRRHLTATDAQHEVSETDPLLPPMYDDYRRGLSEVTRVALDLHMAPGETLRQHQCFLIAAAARYADPRFELQEYLRRFSPAFGRLSALPADPSQAWGWEHEQFWARCFTPGPIAELGPPLQRLWNVVVGFTPRRWDAPEDSAKRLGIDCP